MPAGGLLASAAWACDLALVAAAGARLLAALCIHQFHVCEAARWQAGAAWAPDSRALMVGAAHGGWQLSASSSPCACMRSRGAYLGSPQLACPLLRLPEAEGGARCSSQEVRPVGRPPQQRHARKPCFTRAREGDRIN